MPANPITAYPLTAAGNLPVATAAGQVPVSSGAGTTYTAQTPNMTLIQRIVPTVSASVTFSSIPQTFNNLRLVGNFLITSGANLVINFNGDSIAAHYAYSLTFSSQGGGFTTAVSNSSTRALIAASGGVVVLDIPNYTAGVAGGVNWTGLFSTMTIGTNTLNGNVGGLWVGTDVTSITLADSAAALFAAVGSFELYGY